MTPRDQRAAGADDQLRKALGIYDRDLDANLVQRVIDFARTTPAYVDHVDAASTLNVLRVLDETRATPAGIILDRHRDDVGGERRKPVAVDHAAEAAKLPTPAARLAYAHRHGLK